MCRGEVEPQEGEGGHQEVTQGGRQQQQGRRARAGLLWLLRLNLRLRPGEEEDNEAERLSQHHHGDLQSTLLITSGLSHSLIL